MNIIFLSRREARARQFNLAHPLTLSLVAGLALAVLGSAFALGLQFGRGAHERGLLSDTLSFGSLLAEQKHQISELKQQLQLRVDAMAMRLGEVNAHVIRLDALGKRLTEMADIDSHEFNFELEPPSGGPEGVGEGVSAQIPDLTAMMTRLEQRVNLRDSQLAALENVILARELKEQIRPTGRPVTRAGERSGFGKLIEINHGDGFVTRYAHNQRTLVSVGQAVKRGEAVALMGSTGRSTGPHVHFEVLRNGRQVDPLSFVGR